MTAPAAPAAPATLRVVGLTKRYAATVLDHVSIDFHPGEIHALMGANGAGKSTLCRLIAGLATPSGGDMWLDGQAYRPAGKAGAEAAGVQMVPQELNLIPTLSVAENLFLNRLPRRFGVIDRRRLLDQARRALDRMGLAEIPADAPAGTLGVGRQQLVEIAAALARPGRVLILDEPTAALVAADVHRLFEHLRGLRDTGWAVIYISHRLEEIAAIADRASVLRDGRLLATEPIAELPAPRLIQMMTGEPLAELRPHTSHRRPEPGLRVRRLSRSPHVRDVSFEVARGERVGIAGLIGAGRTELLRAIFGADPADSGAVFVGADPTPWRFTEPRQACRQGLALVTEDRKENGLLLRQSVRDNLTLGNLARFARRGVVRDSLVNAAAEVPVRELDIRCRDLRQSVAELSGGNQQKVAVGKWLSREAVDGAAPTEARKAGRAVPARRVFLFDEPTRGIDVAARRRIHGLIETLAIAGKAIVIVSSDLEELMETCDRIEVMAGGRLVASFGRDRWDRQQLMAACFRDRPRSTEEAPGKP